LNLNNSALTYSSLVEDPHTCPQSTENENVADVEELCIADDLLENDE